MVIENLPNFKAGGGKPSCDLCIKKGKDVPAVMYCTVCTKKHCGKHKEVIVVVIINNSITSVWLRNILVTDFFVSNFKSNSLEVQVSTSYC